MDRDVYIDDAARVHIGARTWMGQGVKILTSSPCLQAGIPEKPYRLCVSRAVIIEADVVIGPGTVVFPGVKIGKGVVVEPLSVVKVDLSAQ